MSEIKPTSPRVSTGSTVAGLFERAVARHGTRTAVIDGEEAWSYDRLNRRANRLAHLLRARGIGRGHLVALLMEGGPLAYAAMLGILKAGAAYLPLDPGCPSERLSDMAARGNTRAIVTCRDWMAQSVCTQHDLKILLDGDGGPDWLGEGQLREQVADNPEPRGNPDDLAYLIYTSGSTGRPKGVLVEQRGVVNLVRWAVDTFQLAPGARVAAGYVIHFDASVQEIFAALCSGATLLPLPPSLKMQPADLLAWLDARAITHWDTVPSLWYQVVNHVRAPGTQTPPALTSLRVLALGGEALHGDMVNAWRDAVTAPHRLYNIYGPTEATVSTTCYALPARVEEGVVPIGAPIDGVEVLLLDADLQPVAAGEVGEICIGGIGLARGYLEPCNGAADAFVDDARGRRLYRSGDLGRLDPHGNLCFVGRRDEQVKIRGYRVELQELENALRALPDVAQAAVLAEEEAPHHVKLLAFVTGARVFDAHALREQLRQHLPPFMLPHHIMPVAEFPMLASQKVDKNALLRLPRDEAPPSPSCERPMSATERLLAEIWCDVLHVAEVNRHDDFFDLGGDSISLMMVQHRCSLAGLSLQLDDIVNLNTIAALARAIDAQCVVGDPSPA